MSDTNETYVPEGYAVCTNGSCGQTYPLSNYDKDTRDVKCDVCKKGYVVGKDGSVRLSTLPHVVKTMSRDDADTFFRRESDDIRDDRLRLRRATESLLDDGGNVELLRNERDRLKDERTWLDGQIHRLNDMLGDFD